MHMRCTDWCEIIVPIEKIELNDHKTNHDWRDANSAVAAEPMPSLAKTMRDFIAKEKNSR